MRAASRTPTRATPRSVAKPVWAALARAGRPLSAPDLHQSTGLDLCAIHKRLASWRDAGLLTEIHERPRRYAMTDTAAAAPCAPIVSTHGGAILFRPRTTRDRIWAGMRVLKTFDMPTLHMVAEVPLPQLRTYFNALLRGGYVASVRSEGTTPRFRLVRNTGPKAPSLVNQRGGGRIIRDRNTGGVVPAPPARTYRSTSAAPADGGVS